MINRIKEIDGIGPVHGGKLKAAGVTTIAMLLDRASDRYGRGELAKASGIEDALILQWTKMADLMRIKGVGEEYSGLLRAVGVDSVKELRSRNPENLAEAMASANAVRKLVGKIPSEHEVADWVNQAQQLDSAMTE